MLAGMYEHLGAAFVKGDFTLLFERRGRALKKATKGPAVGPKKFNAGPKKSSCRA